MSKCNHDCFNCTYDDCIVGVTQISKEERKEIKERDKRYFNGADSRALKQIPSRARQKIVV
jgi:hypothetical protein